MDPWYKVTQDFAYAPQAQDDGYRSSPSYVEWPNGLQIYEAMPAPDFPVPQAVDRVRSRSVGPSSWSARPFTPWHATVDNGHGQTDYEGNVAPAGPASWDASSSRLWYWTDWRKMLRRENQDRMCLAAEIDEVEQKMAPLEAAEQIIWTAYGKSDPFDQDQLLKECQHRVRSAPSTTVEFEKVRLALLSELHELRQTKFGLLQELLSRSRPRAGSIPYPISGMHTTVPGSSSGDRFWAVVVGVNHYFSHQMDLEGCVPDAHLMRECLVSDLSVPRSHVKLLTEHSNEVGVRTDGLPTRANILTALCSHLRDNPEIQYGDNMIFYFSGHGSSYRASEYFTSEAGSVGSIEALCPADRGTVVEGYDPVLDISDRELNTIFSEIRNFKGPNITVILDCCHSGGATRAIGAVTHVARYAPPLPHSLEMMLRAADEDPHRDRSHASMSVLAEEWTEDMSSHVVLAACQNYELAFETHVPNRSKSHGVFTAALVAALRSSIGKDPKTTYQTLIGSGIGKLQRQTPIVAGNRRKARLWFQDSTLSVRSEMLYTPRGSPISSPRYI